jgi:hypothetical protein
MDSKVQIPKGTSNSLFIYILRFSPSESKIYEEISAKPLIPKET